MKPLRIVFATSRRRLRPATFIGALCLLTSASLSVAGAAVYRWVDDQGKIHYAAVVPQRYQGVAKPVGAAANEPSAEQRRDALARAQQEKAKAAEMASVRQRPPTSNPPAAAGSAPTVKRPTQLPNAQTDCKTWQRLYLESIDCFRPFLTVHGATKPAAFEVCNDVSEPPPSRCRLLIP